jgi:hypothetical protein
MIRYPARVMPVAGNRIPAASVSDRRAVWRRPSSEVHLTFATQLSAGMGCECQMQNFTRNLILLVVF